MKKKIIKVLVTGIIIFLLLITLGMSQRFYIQSNTEKYQSIISEQNQFSHAYTYPYRNDEVEAFKITINTDKEVRFNYWRKDFFGKIQVVIFDERNKVVEEFPTSRGYNSKSVKLKKGNYVISAKINSLMGGFVLGYGNMTIDREPQKDSDNDGLPDNYEMEYGIDISDKDTDRDGLSDYEEIVKYKTNPLLKDSDGDEVILYPETSLIINPTVYERNKVQNEYTIPTFTKNYSSKMMDEITKKISGRKTDIQVVSKLISELRSIKSIDIAKDLKMDTNMPLDFALVKSQNNIVVSPERKSTAFSMDEIQKKFCSQIRCIRIKHVGHAVLQQY